MPAESSTHREPHLWLLQLFIFMKIGPLYFHETVSSFMSEQCYRVGVIVQYEEKLIKQISFSSLRIELLLFSLYWWHFPCPHQVKIFSFLLFLLLFLQLRKDSSSYQEETFSLAQYSHKAQSIHLVKNVRVTYSNHRHVE